MGIKLYTADLHFGHSNVIKFDNRPFADIDEMDRCLIELWNSRVAPDDDVYLIGDVCFRNNKPEEWYLRQLKGHKHLVIGNHDRKLLDNQTAMSCFETIDKMMHVRDEDKHICLCHYPLAEWNGFFKGTYHIYGHIHNRKDGAYMYMKNFENALNAGCMINNYMPASLDELIRNNEVFKKDVS